MGVAPEPREPVAFDEAPHLEQVVGPLFWNARECLGRRPVVGELEEAAEEDRYVTACVMRQPLAWRSGARSGLARTCAKAFLRMGRGLSYR